MDSAERRWRVAIHLGDEKIGLKGEYSGPLALSLAADVCSTQGALDLLETWFNLDKQASFQVLITEQRVPPATLLTTHAPFALHFIAVTIERALCRDALGAHHAHDAHHQDGRREPRAESSRDDAPLSAAE